MYPDMMETGEAGMMDMSPSEIEASKIQTVIDLAKTADSLGTNILYMCSDAREQSLLNAAVREIRKVLINTAFQIYSLPDYNENAASE